MPFLRIYFYRRNEIKRFIRETLRCFFSENHTNEKKKLQNKNTIKIDYDSFKLRCTMKSTEKNTLSMKTMDNVRCDL